MICLFFASIIFGIAYSSPKATTTYTVSGISSGAYFAVQHAVAFSASVTGVGVVAGGPYYCAEGSETKALTDCMSTPEMIDLNSLISYTKTSADSGAIDAVSNMANLKAYLYSGKDDTVVNTGCVEKAVQYFQTFVTDKSQVYFQNNVSSEHAMITNYYGNKCSYKGDPYINNCGFDLSAAILEWMYGKLNPPVSTKNLPYNNVIEINQEKFVPSGKTATGICMETKAYAYVPTNCDIAPLSSTCRLHVVYHGCVQYLTYTYLNMTDFKMVVFNDTYVRNTGYNLWAETNNIVVLYPQATKNEIENPEGCWDWWGYLSNDKDYVQKSGVQLATVANMINYILG